MKKMEYQNVRGTQDFLPVAEVVRRKIRRTLEDVFIQYGCQPLETPILNYTELLSSKYGGGAEILEEMYTLSDRGKRELALRYDLTIPFTKVIAMNPTIRLPFKRYEIGKVFRDGPIKTGRFREFTQCDVDMVGVDSQIAEAELMMMALDAFRRLGLEVIIQYNNRKLLTGLLEVFQTPREKMNKVVLILDKLEKIGADGVVNELTELGLEATTNNKISQFLNSKKNTDYSYFESFTKKNPLLQKGLDELKEREGYLKGLGLKAECIFNPFLARGLEIYTGSIYEIFLKDESIKSSIGSGGRYDNAIGGLLGTDQKFSTVGISFGLDVIYTAISSKEKKHQEESSIDYYVIPINTEKESLKVARQFRERGYNVEMELGKRKLGKLMEKANKEGFANVIIIGEEEIKLNQIKIKEMKSGQERTEYFPF